MDMASALSRAVPGEPLHWWRTVQAMVSQIVAPSGIRRRRAREAGAAGLVSPGAPDPDLLRRFRIAAMPLLDDAYSFARYLCRDETAAEDIVHDAYIRALRGFAGFRGDDMKPWLFAIVRNCFYSWARTARPGQHADAPDDGIEALEPDTDTPESLLIKSEEGAALHALITALPIQYREVLMLREVEHLSYRDIAATIDAPIGTVMSRLARARELLAAAWRKREAGASA
jgi:RNA polymerase sigma-70 factor (ECF subfamily)